MTLFPPIHSALFVAIALSAFGCNNDDGLAVRGEAVVTFAPDYAERFSFESDTHLQEDGLAAGAEGVFGGNCTLSEAGLTRADVEVNRPGETAGLTSFRVQAAAVGGGEMRAVVDGAVLDGSGAGGACTITTLYATMQDGIAGVEVDCEVSDIDGNVAQATAELHFAGCLVTD